MSRASLLALPSRRNQRDNIEMLGLSFVCIARASERDAVNDRRLRGRRSFTFETDRGQFARAATRLSANTHMPVDARCQPPRVAKLQGETKRSFK
jgi:hypothetical protein